MKSSLESLYSNKKILITGHSGFKGSWLSLMLSKLNANIYGISINDNYDFSMFKSANIDKITHNFYQDIRDYEKLNKIIKLIKPDFIFHLAAKSLVLNSIANPLDTLTTNIIGTANILESVRYLKTDCKTIVVTSDKCYENNHILSGYREDDRLGGTDPYSMSKAATELVAACWNKTYFDSRSKHIATVRAGNVIGGGDWSTNRIVPDCINSLIKNKKIILRNPNAIRPWQYVLDPLYGYLLVGKFMSDSGDKNFNLNWNFGPTMSNIITVEELTKSIVTKWGKGQYKYSATRKENEHSFLNINSDKAYLTLGWKPSLDIDNSLEQTISWYKAFHSGEDMYKFSAKQVFNFLNKYK
jgi:CDP-glucose 4,6-dehydratase